MRAISYESRRRSETFRPLEPHQMIRQAVVEGLKQNYSFGEQHKHQRILEELIKLREPFVYQGKPLTEKQFAQKLADFRRSLTLNKKQFGMMHVMLAAVAYNSSNWGRLTEKKRNLLIKNKIIIPFNGDNSELVDKIDEIDERKVILVENPVLEPDKDYVKHLPPTRKLILNGYDVVSTFAKQKGFELPKNYRGTLTKKVKNLLREHDFTLQEAFRTAFNHVLKSEKYKNRNIAALVIKNKDGTEQRLRPHDMVGAAELFVHSVEYGPEVKKALGDYAGNVYKVPKRIPEMDIGSGKIQTHNTIETHYPPKEWDSVSWMDIKLTCDCSKAVNLRNMEQKRQEMKRVPNSIDIHCNTAFLYRLRENNQNAVKFPNNISLVPTPKFLREVDKLRYNVVMVQKEHYNDRQEMIYLRERAINVLIFKMFQTGGLTYEKAFQPQVRMKQNLLRPM